MAGIKGMDNLLKDLDKIQRELPHESRKFLNNLGNRVKAKAKVKVPVDTGELRASIKTKTINENEVKIYSNKEYAPHMEYGHRTRNGGFVEGKYFLKNSIDEVKMDLPLLGKKFVKEVLKK